MGGGGGELDYGNSEIFTPSPSPPPFSPCNQKGLECRNLLNSTLNILKINHICIVSQTIESSRERRITTIGEKIK